MKQQRTLIYLKATEQPQASWVRWNENNEIVQSVEQGDLEQLSEFTNDTIYVVLPNEDVVLTYTILPKLTRQRLLQALPFALEDQLIPDVDELHFAIGKQQAGGAVPVAIVSKEKMRAWINLFQTLGLNPTAFIPAIFLLPLTTGEWHVNTGTEECLVRTSFWTGFACEKSQLDTWLSLKKIEDKLTELPPITYSELSRLQLLETQGEKLPASLTLNLLQGEYQPKRQTGRTRNLWRMITSLLLTCVILALISNSISFLILRGEASHLEKEISKIYFHQFPKANSLVAPKERMAEKLRKLEGSGGKNIYFVLIAELGKSLMKSPGIKIQHLAFNDQRLNLEITATSFDQVDEMIHLLTQAGLSVKQQNATTVGTQVKVTLILSAGKL